MDCTAIRPLISYYYDGEVTPEESALVEQHLAGCEDCRRVLAEYRMIGSEMRDMAMPVPPAGLHRDVWRAIEAQGAIPKRAPSRPTGQGKIVDFPGAGAKRRPAFATLATSLGNGWARAVPAALLVAALGIMVAVIMLVQGRIGSNEPATLASSGPYTDYAQQVQVQFSKSVLSESVTNSTQVLLVHGTVSDTVSTTKTFNEQSRVLTIAPQPVWEAGGQYRIVIDASRVIVSGVGTPLDTKPIMLGFSVAEYTPTPTSTPVPPVYTSTTVPSDTPEPTREATNTPVNGVEATATPQGEVTAIVEPSATSTEVPTTDTPAPIPTDTAVPPTDTVEPTATATETAVPSATATQPVETATPTVVPSTPTPVQPCSLMPVNGFGKIWDEYAKVRDRIGCPTAAEFALPAAAQERFEGGYMFWRMDIKKIYVFYGNPNTDTVGVWAEYDDTWSDGTPVATTPGLPTATPYVQATVVGSPPEGKYIPVRGFGKLWAENATVRARLGWAIEQEQGVTGAFQEFEHGSALWTDNKIIRFMYTDAGGSENIWERFADTFVAPTATP